MTSSDTVMSRMSDEKSIEDLLALTPAGNDRFIAHGGTVNHIGTMYGGRMLGQALRAAVSGVEALPLASLHAYFLAPGKVEQALEFDVQRLRDSRRFANRQVHVRQSGRLLVTLLCEFHAFEDSYMHQSVAMPAVPPPEAVVPLQKFIARHESCLDPAAIRNFRGATPIEMRPVAPERYFLERPVDPRRAFWFRVPGTESVADPRLQQCLLAFASDYWLGGAAAIPHTLPTNGKDLLISSLDHAVWFHRPVRCEQWMLHETFSPSASDGLGLVQGRIFSRDGCLLATTTQECLLRRLDGSAASSVQA